jgi:hypothetical protein
MSVQNSLSELAEAVFAKKRAARRLAAQLSVEEKFEILLRLQGLTYEVGMSQRGHARKPWNLTAARQYLHVPIS